MFMPLDLIISLVRILLKEMVVTGRDWEEGDILHVKVFIHKVMSNNEPGIMPMTNNKEMVNETMMYLIYLFHWILHNH